jgi:transposase
MRTIIGIDPHKSSLTAVAVDDRGAVLGTRRVTVNKGTGTALLKWAAAFEDLLFAVEGAKGLGRSIPQILVARNQAVMFPRLCR